MNAQWKAVGFMFCWVFVVGLEEVLHGVHQITRHEMKDEPAGTPEGSTLA